MNCTWLCAPWQRDAPLALSNRSLIDTGNTLAHVALVVKLPILIAIRPEPLTTDVVVLVFEAYCDTILVESPQVLAQHIVKLFCPLSPQEIFDLLPPLDELRPVSPLRVFAVRCRNGIDILPIPSRFCCLHLLERRFRREGGQRWSRSFGRHRRG